LECPRRYDREPVVPYGLGAHQHKRNYQYEDAARWAEGHDIADRAVLGDCARDAGLSRDDFLKGLDDEHYRNALWARALAGLEEGVFGVPFFVVDGERFWGNDRLEFLLDALRGRT
jgi:2-hydroxychromene-2-carboxylate isomerase